MAPKSIDKTEVVRKTDEQLAAEEAKMNADAASAAEREALEIETVTFTVDINGTDVEFTTPADILDCSDEVLEHFDNNKQYAAFMAIIGAEQKAKMRAAGSTGRIVMEKVIPAWNEAMGMGEG